MILTVPLYTFDINAGMFLAPGGSVRVSRQEAIVLRLALASDGQPVPMADLMAAFYPDTHRPNNPQNVIRVVVANLRRKLLTVGAGEMLERARPVGRPTDVRA